MTEEKPVFVLSPKGWASVAASSYPVSLTPSEIFMLVAAMESYSNETYSTDESYDPRPLEDLRAKLNELVSQLPPQV